MEYVKKSSRANINHVHLCPAPEAHGGKIISSKGLAYPHAYGLRVAAHKASLLDWLYLLPAALFNRYSMSLASPRSWDLHCSFDFTVIASHATLEGTQILLYIFA